MIVRPRVGHALFALFFWLFVASLLSGGQAKEPADPPALTPLEQCQSDTLDLRAALVEWQARAFAAEAQLARDALARERAAFDAKVGAR